MSKITVGKEGHPEGNCQRCGKWSGFLWTLGNMNKKPYSYVCDECHDYWKKNHVGELMKMGDWNMRTTKEREEFLDRELEIFMKNGKEVVQFT